MQCFVAYHESNHAVTSTSDEKLSWAYSIDIWPSKGMFLKYLIRAIGVESLLPLLQVLRHPRPLPMNAQKFFKMQKRGTMQLLNGHGP